MIYNICVTFSRSQNLRPGLLPYADVRFHTYLSVVTVQAFSFIRMRMQIMSFRLLVKERNSVIDDHENFEDIQRIEQGRTYFLYLNILGKDANK